MKILVTGGSGLLASMWKNEPDVEMISRESGADYTDIDCMKRQLSRHSPDVVINTVGLTNVELCEQNPSLALEVNALSSVCVAEVCHELKIKLVHISTDHLWDDGNAFHSETDAPVLVNIYARSKYEAEQRVQRALPDSLILRTNFFGKGTETRRSFSDWVLCSLRNREEITLFDDVLFNPVHGKTILQTAKHLVSSGASGVYNVASSDCCSKWEFGMKLAELFSLDSSVIHRSHMRSSIPRPVNMKLSVEKLAAAGGEVYPIDYHIRLLTKEQS